MDIKKTANLFINFTIKRLAEIFGIIIFFFWDYYYFIGIISYSPEDPNFIFPDNTEIKNILGFQGSFVSDLFFQSIGLISYLFSLTLIITGINIFRIKDFFLIIENIFFAIIYSLFGTFFFSIFLFKCIYSLYKWKWWFYWFLFKSNFLKSLILINETIFYYILIILNLFLFLISINFHPIKFYKTIKKLFKFFLKK